jgi:hypothetical protein
MNHTNDETQDSVLSFLLENSTSARTTHDPASTATITEAHPTPRTTLVPSPAPAGGARLDFATEDHQACVGKATARAAVELPSLLAMATPTAADLKIDRLAIPPGCTLRFTFYALRPDWDETFARFMRRPAPSSLQGRVRLQVPATLGMRAGEWRPALFVQREALAAAGLADIPTGAYFANFFGQEAWLAACRVSVANVDGVNQLTRFGFLRGTPRKSSSAGNLTERALAGLERDADQRHAGE